MRILVCILLLALGCSVHAAKLASEQALSDSPISNERDQGGGGKSSGGGGGG